MTTGSNPGTKTIVNMLHGGFLLAGLKLQINYTLKDFFFNFNAYSYLNDNKL